MKFLALLLATIPAAVPAAFASDHIDGPVSIANRVADLTDLYVFPTPGAKGKLSLILDTYPLVTPTGHFSDKVNYTIYLRRARVTGTGDHPVFETSDEVSITCSFKTGEVTEDHVATCKGPNGLIAETKFNVVEDMQEGDTVHLFAGMRSDPFFFSAGFAVLAGRGILLPTYMLPSYLRLSADVMKHANMLAMVMEIETAKLWKDNTPSLIAVAAESTGIDAPGATPHRIDRVGRPEITNVTMATRKGDPELRDAYNAERPFNVTRSVAATMKERIFRNIDLYDHLDKKKNWNDSDRDALASILVDDFIVVDMSKSCDGADFFGIEKSLLKHEAYSSCGGRRPNDDIMDTWFTLYIAGLNGKHVSDGVDHPYTPVSGSFPYLAAPDLKWHPLNALKIKAAKKFLGIKDETP